MIDRVFAIGDIHGCYDALRTLIEKKFELTKNDKLILLGDYINKGQKSKEVVDYILELQYEGFDVVALMGNHEAMLLESRNKKIHLERWLQSGGTETLKSFGIKSLKDMDRKYIQFFKNLLFYYKYSDFLFVHAGFNDTLKKPFEEKYSMVWRCRDKYSHPKLKNKIIVHGHCPITVANCINRVRTNYPVIDLDTGCVYADRLGFGRLTGIEVNSMKLFFV
ncbi:MAG: serine/threonine protein phosphatase [Bacteroidales bacterium]|nr:serine/threonine protein phosphatase [Bacteroidales bacterium]MCF8455335.1 serine/threonine protein phosphatase [Bacteroidales bacterium]